MPTERVSFKGHSGATLAARLDVPKGPHLATAIFAHCFTCGKDIAAARRISARLAADGIAVLRFDFTGLWHSGGEFASTSFSSNVEDLHAAAAYLADRNIPAQLVIGQSLGGAAVLRAAPQISGVKAIATLGAPFDPAHVLENFSADLTRIQRYGKAKVCLNGRPFDISQGFIDDVQQSQLTQALGALKAALLVLHAPRDAIVGIDNAAQIFTHAKHPKSFLSLDNADHLISNSEDAEYAASAIATWSRRYLALPRPAPPPGAPEGIVRVKEADPNGFLQDITSEHHHSLADEPRAYGGTNRGMSPYGFLAAGLGACTSMTIRMYARRKSWPLQSVNVDVSHEKVHAQDASDAHGAKIDRWHRTITLEGKLTDDQRQKLLSIADKCPVHRTLEQSSTVVTRLCP
jgi:putative redox protein